MATGIRNDLRFSLRVLLRSPGFTLIAVSSLALGIGANSAIFTLANAVFLSPLPIQEPGRLLSLFTIDQSGKANAPGSGRTPLSFPNYEDYRDRNEVFSGLAAYYPTVASLVNPTGSSPVPVMLVTGNYFDVLGVKAQWGREFKRDDDRHPGGDNITVLSHALWTETFGADPKILGRNIILNSTTYTVVGVMPPGFKGTLTLSAPEVAWIPMSMHGQIISGQLEQMFYQRRPRFLNVVGRLKSGVSESQALPAMRTIASQLEKAYPIPNKARTVDVAPLMEGALGALPKGQMVTAAFALFAVCGVVLFIACANIANLLLVRMGARASELGVRVALGASRARLARLLLTETSLLCGAGGICGLLLGFAGCRLLWRFRPPFLQPNAIVLPLDMRVVAFTVGLTCLSAILAGLIPAFRSSARDTSVILNSSGRGRTLSATEIAFRNALVVAEIAFALSSLCGAGLFVRSMLNVQNADMGFEAHNLAAFSFNLASRNYSDERGRQFIRALQNRISVLPGVRNVAIAADAPLSTGVLGTIIAEGSIDPNDRGTPTVFNPVSPPYFATLGIRLEKGRVFNEFDRQDSQKVAVINRAMERYFWPGQDAMGRRFRFFREDILREVVGVVSDSVVLSAGETPRPVAYLPLDQLFLPSLTVDVRTSADPNGMLDSILREVKRLDSQLVLTGSHTIQDLIAQGLWAPRMAAALFGTFGILASVLAAVGIYGVIAHTVSLRTNEIGVRMALGANASDVMRMIVVQTLRLAAAGIVIGIAIELVLSRLLRGLLFNLSPEDPLTLAIVGLSIAVIATAAGMIPALRAASIDPAAALRQA